MSRTHRFTDAGQAMLAMVLGLTLMMALGASILATNVIQQDPLVQSDIVGHYAYRGLEAGINTFMSDANANPNELACSHTSPVGGQCVPSDFLAWKPVPNTSGGGAVPEWYAWGDPRFCFSNSCPTPTTVAPTKPVLYVKETVYGAAGFPGHLSYEQSTLNLKAVNGFLTRVWWSTYEATDPAANGGTTSDCTYDWKNTYNGPNITGNFCQPVVFASGTQIYGPIYSNDSIYITGRPTLGPVQTADPKYLFVQIQTCPAKPKKCITKVSQEGKTKTRRAVIQTTATFAASASGKPLEPLPKTDATLEKLAAFDGCVYRGPTTITFEATDKMRVWSKNTPAVGATATKPACPSTHTSSGAASTGTAVVPNETHGNGTIFVETVPPATSCASGSNPLARQRYTTGAYAFMGASSNVTCEGDVFVSDAPSTGRVTGQLSIDAANNVVITGTVKYKDCGTTFTSTVQHPCKFNRTGRNDSLGLIAQNYVLINRPLRMARYYTYFRGQYITAITPRHIATPCTSSRLGTPAAGTCNPVPNTPTSTLTVDAAILALNHSFAVDNYTVTGIDGTLKVYGSIDQKWRGTVGRVGSTGYIKNYDWNSVSAAITPPHYLAPGTPSWAVGSSAIEVLGQAPAGSPAGPGTAP